MRLPWVRYRYDSLENSALQTGCWLAAEFILGLIGLNNLYDYGEFLGHSKPSHH